MIELCIFVPHFEEIRIFLEELIQFLKEYLSLPRTFSIVIHRNPDGDALGSGLALYSFLRKDNHDVTLISPSEFPVNFSWMQGSEDILVYDLDEDATRKAIDKADYVFCLDFNALDRIDHIGKYMHKNEKKAILIDHHVDPEPFAEFMFSDSDASSTCELIFRLLESLGAKEPFDINLIEALYTGIVTDTGSFRHSTNPEVFRIMMKLKSMGLDDYSVQDRIFNSVTEKQLKLLGHCLANRFEVLEEGRVGLITLTKEDYENFDIQRGDTEGIVNYPLTMPGVVISALITNQPKLVKLSLRSKGDVSVQALARNHFNGGGHINASGGYSFKPLNVIVNRFKDVVHKYL